MSKRDIAIAGMTCAACEDTVSQAFADLPGVDTVKASARTGMVRLTGRSLPVDAALASALAGTPYRLGARRWLARERSVWQDIALGLAAVAVLFVAISVWDPGSRMGGLGSGLTIGSALVVLGLGVAASVSTCMALVGGLVLSLSASGRAAPAHSQGILSRQVAFNAGRIVGFGALGAVAGLAGSAFALQGLPLAIAMIAVALVTAILGIRLTDASPRVAAWQVTLPSSWARWAKRSPQTADASAGAGGATRAPLLRAAALGAATFFLPCGFTQAVQLLALSSGSAVSGGAIMALFAVGTTPGLLAVGLAGASARGASARGGSSRRPLRIVGVVVVGFAVVTGLGALTGTGLLDSRPEITATERTANVVDVDGRQVVTTEIGLQGYFPADAVVYVDEPVTWVLDPVGVGCASLVDAGSMGLGRLNAISEKVSSEFTPTEAKTYEYHCAMGMYSGSITAIERPSDATS